MYHTRAIMLALLVIFTTYEIGVNASPVASGYDYNYWYPRYYPTYYRGGDTTTKIKNQSNCNNKQTGAGVLPIGAQGVLSPCINSQS